MSVLFYPINKDEHIILSFFYVKEMKGLILNLNCYLTRHEKAV